MGVSIRWETLSRRQNQNQIHAKTADEKLGKRLEKRASNSTVKHNTKVKLRLANSCEQKKHDSGVQEPKRSSYDV